jgi:hypothetical protein
LKKVFGRFRMKDFAHLVAITRVPKCIGTRADEKFFATKI